MWMYKLWMRKPFKGRWKWLFPLVISDLPMFALMISYVCHNLSGIQAYSLFRVAAFLLVGIWTYMGPLMILWWREAAETLVKDIDRIPGSGGTARMALEQKTVWFTVFSLLWPLVPLGILLTRKGQAIMESFFFFGLKDWNYWLFLLCVLYVAWQTAVFYRFLFSSRNLIRAISENKAIMRCLLSNEGKRLSLSSIGSFVAKSVIYTSSGVLFFPILVEFFAEQGGRAQAEGTAAPLEQIHLDVSILVFVLMGIFLLAILLYLQSINRIVNERAQSVKDEMITELEEQRDWFTLRRRKNCRRLNRAIYYRMEEQTLDDQIRRLVAVNIDPIGMDQQMQLFSGIFITAFLPAMFSVILGKL